MSICLQTSANLLRKVDACRRDIELYSSVESFGQPRQSRAVIELFETFIPYIALNVVMVMAVQRGHPLVALALTGLAAAFLGTRVHHFSLIAATAPSFLPSSCEPNRGIRCGPAHLDPLRQVASAPHAEHHATAGPTCLAAASATSGR